MRWIFTAALLCAFSHPLSAKTKSLNEHWDDLALEFSSVQDLFENASCAATERQFLGCANALNAALHEANWSLIPTSRAKQFGAEIKNFGPVSVVETTENNLTSLAASLTAIRKERKAAHKGWVTLFQSGKLVDTAAIALWVSEQPFYKKNESVLSAKLFNTFLMVTRDPHTMALPSAYVQANSTGNGEKFSGIGAVFRVLSQNGKEQFLVDTPLEGSPALRAGLRTNDVLVEVDGVAVKGMPFADVVSRIRGKKATQVTLTVDRDGAKLDIPITRGDINIRNVQSKILDYGGRELGYVKLNSFLRPTGCSELEAAIGKLHFAGVEGLILDLRGNGGGLITQSVCVADLFLDTETAVVRTKTNSILFPTRTLRTEKPAATRLPMATLVNDRSASASEIVSGALQDHRRSLVVGTRTFGKGTIQNQRPLSGGALILRETIGRFYLPSGRSNQLTGVVPDLEVFANPTPTADDKVAYRESDEYLALPEEGDPWVQPRPQVVNRVKTCADSSGVATKRFNGHTAAIKPDFQLLYAEEVLKCAIDQGVPMPVAEAVEMKKLVPAGFGS